MSFIFGRRRAQSDVAAGHSDAGSRKSSREHHQPSSALGTEATDSGIFHGLFRKRSDSDLCLSSSEHAKQVTRQNLPRLNIKDLPTRERGREACQHGPRDSTPNTPRSPEPLPAAAHSEPKQPGNLQDYLEYRLDTSGLPHDSTESEASSARGSVLTTKDVKALFSGAPHFMLERGKHGRWYPQVIFPWDEHNPSIQNRLDRKLLSHASFTLCTLHAHLPVPDDWAVMGGVPIPLQDWRRTGAFKRATFDVGVFEVPNMLGNNGKEPGTIGFRNFLELSIADLLKYTGPEEPKHSPNMQRVQSLSATEAFELMDQYNKPYSQCLSGAVYDRHKLIRDGPAGWKRIGVRDINLRYLVQRLDQLRQLRLDILRQGSTITILDIETPPELHSILHTHFLYPHPPSAVVQSGHPQSLKSQIKTLATVLATPGAWLDFSLPEWRFRAGQILWEVPPHGDGDCLELHDCASGTAKQPWVNSGMERKWLFVQVVLAAELLFRLDAFVRVGMLHDPHGGQITVHELQHFEQLREGKVNWDLIFVRRFLNSLEVTCDATTPTPSSVGGLSPASASASADRSPTPPTKPHRFSLFDSLSRRISSTQGDDVRSAWQCQVSSPYVRQQLEGLYIFAENIGWPKVDALRSHFQTLSNSGQSLFTPNANISDPCSSGWKTVVAKDQMYSRSRSRRCVQLRSSCREDHDPHASEVLGWISRSWLSGFVIPGEPICHLLIGTLLENDPDVIERLGPTANLYGGFVYEGRSYWSKASIVGRVLSSLDGAKTCMGWVGSDVLPRDETTLEPLNPGWFEVLMQKAIRGSGKSRIKQGGKLALESSPLGMGDITAEAFTLPVDQPTSESTKVNLVHLTLLVRSPCKRGITACDQASLSFSLQSDTMPSATTASFPLKYNVRFISAHECCRPLGVTAHHEDVPRPHDRQQQQQQQSAPDQGKYRRLPGHPLHRSFPYQHVSLDSLSQRPAPQLSSAPAGHPEVLVIDARGCRAKETFVRAWCASVGCHAVIGRAGRTCVACCVREARALEVPVVVRVGEPIELGKARRSEE
ncbi:uncharacterized protein N7482_004885 [Penicillium canariense]|uniref:Uncharacterized protein n=1 Tax=Penicillium canariense TaxID=189055 RepID=A0A9W9LLP0_9EURO|nr:uncharacterized protein N7482_004885 [Penicillium canariense]KAJ5166104.1 hypothetical protein N7482_004885 [Penicillium canariense]